MAIGQPQTPEGGSAVQNPQGGGDVMKDAAVGIMQQAETLTQVAQVLGQKGAKGPAEKLAQAAQLMTAAIQELGISQGQPQAGPQQAPGTPEAAGPAGPPVAA